ncbi:hypothetical protein MAR_009229, partial [Mya arenaria]
MKCNGIRECADGIDETICRSVCANGEVQCAGGQCATLCNKMAECIGPDGTVMDEGFVKAMIRLAVIRYRY